MALTEGGLPATLVTLREQEAVKEKEREREREKEAARMRDSEVDDALLAAI